MFSIAPGREVVEHVDAMAAAEQLVGEVRADEAGAAGDQDAHGLSPQCPMTIRARARPMRPYRLPRPGGRYEPAEAGVQAADERDADERPP